MLCCATYFLTVETLTGWKPDICQFCQLSHQQPSIWPSTVRSVLSTLASKWWLNEIKAESFLGQKCPSYGGGWWCLNLWFHFLDNGTIEFRTHSLASFYVLIAPTENGITIRKVYQILVKTCWIIQLIRLLNYQLINSIMKNQISKYTLQNYLVQYVT